MYGDYSAFLILASLGWGFFPLGLYLPVAHYIRKQSQVYPAKLWLVTGFSVAGTYLFLAFLVLILGASLNGSPGGSSQICGLIFMCAGLMILTTFSLSGWLVLIFCVRWLFRLDKKGPFGAAHPWPRWQFQLTDLLFLSLALGLFGWACAEVRIEHLEKSGLIFRDPGLLITAIFATLTALDLLRRMPAWKNPLLRGAVILGIHALFFGSVWASVWTITWGPCTYLLWRSLLVAHDKALWLKANPSPASTKK